jgi:hypothetical protein
METESEEKEGADGRLIDRSAMFKRLKLSLGRI